VRGAGCAVLKIGSRLSTWLEGSLVSDKTSLQKSEPGLA
jgi:hypothetical protein